MSDGGLGRFGAYQKSVELFDLVANDMEELKSEFSLGRLASQQLASADSICANIEEGYGRISRKEYIRFLDFARGSARETHGRYHRLRHWLKPQVIEGRRALADEIIGILTSTITTLRRQGGNLHEDPSEYDLSPTNPVAPNH